jgi:biopolymer transport protein TolQ
MTLPFLPIFIGSAQSPFVTAWLDSDFVGRMIVIALVGLSLISWTIIIHKWWITRRVKQESLLFKRSFFEQKRNPLSISYARVTHPETPNAFHIVYEVLKTKAAELLEKNQRGGKSEGEGSARGSRLAASDLALLETLACSAISTVTKYLERNLYLLSTIVTLAPFLGLLGTVYGILVTFSGLGDGSMGSNAQILGGLSLALTTTVIGLLNAIPALVGYNYLKNSIAEFDHEMERFATEVLATFDMHYRTVEV